MDFGLTVCMRFETWWRAEFFRCLYLTRRILRRFDSPEFPSERLVACFNPLLAEERGRKRQELLEATEKELERIAKQVVRRTQNPLGKDEIGKKVGKVIDRFKVGKHFTVTIGEGIVFPSCAMKTRLAERKRWMEFMSFAPVNRQSVFLRKTRCVAIRISHKWSALFRSLKGIDLLVRPIWHHTEDHVRAHIFICMLAYYVEWHMRKALAPFCSMMKNWMRIVRNEIR